MKIICRTNIDKWKMTKWPTNFVSVPRIGDTIRGTGPGDYRPELCVVQVTHTEDKHHHHDIDGDFTTTECYIEIELHLHKGLTLKGLGWDK